MTLTETEAAFGPLVAERDCGGCRVCCEHLVIDTPEFSKPAGVLCRHACAVGCGIYDIRYPVCRDWSCLWRYIDALPDAARPDRCGVMWGYAWSEGDHARFMTRYVHGLCHGGLSALDAAEGRAALAHFRAEALPVWVSEPGGPLQMRHPARQEATAPEWDAGIRQT